MATPLNEDFPENGSARRGGLTWGKVVKGAAVVTAIAVVAVGGYLALSAIAGWAMGSAAVSGVVGTAATVGQSAAVSVAGPLGYAFEFITGTLPSAISAFVTSAFGISTSAAVVSGAAAAPAVISTAGAVGAGGAAALAASHHGFFSNMYDNLFGGAETASAHAAADTSAATTSFMATKKAAMTSGMAAEHASHSSHTTADLAHHAGEHARHESRQNWSQRVAKPSSFSYDNQPPQSYADAVRSHEARRAAVQPRDANFAAQVDADREKLDAALGDSTGRA